VGLERFAVAQFPVTNAEWQRFMLARGYDDERWWDTEAARRWRHGEGVGEFEALLDTWYPAGRQTQPAQWNDPAFNHVSQPVVGVCWYEARAYCAWLSVQTGRVMRLPTEAEWEAAARGRGMRRYSWGECSREVTHLHLRA
jgi:formylglycine-generating enzyme required for sulfatase activity